MTVVVVVPTFNEAQTIEAVLRRTRAAAPEVEVLVVDDASPDGTADLAEKVGQEIGGVHVMRRERRFGFGAAYRAGFDWALDYGADVLVQMDADLSHDPAALPELLAPLPACDLVIGSRYIPGGSIPQWSLPRRLLSRTGNLYSTMLLGLRVKDMTSGYRVFRADLVRAIDMGTVKSDGYSFQIEVAYRASRAGARIREVPIRFVDRELGESKMSTSIVLEALTLVTRLGAARLRASAERRRSPAAGHLR